MSEQLHTDRISVDDSEIADLRARLAQTRWPEESPADGRERGIRLEDVRALAEHWEHSFDWRALEERLGRMPQLVAEIDGQRIHVLHVRSSHPDARPILLTHGYPSSNVEFVRLIELLTEPEHGPAFHVVAPSLPGYGFSTPLTGAGWTMARTARAWIELMDLLGYDRFGVHGGDVGAGVSGFVASLAGDRVTGLHTVTDPMTAASTATFIPGMADSLDADDPVDRVILDRMAHFRDDASGYLAIQNTRPQTIGYGLTDSPVFLLAWIVEKLQDWTEVDLDADQLLAIVSTAWFGAAGASAAHYLYDQAHAHEWGGQVSVPQAMTVFGADETVRRIVPVSEGTRWTEYTEGMHFPAMELPEVLARDLQEFFGPLA